MPLQYCARLKFRFLLLLRSKLLSAMRLLISPVQLVLYVFLSQISSEIPRRALDGST